MWNKIIENIDVQFFIYLGVIACLMVANTFFRLGLTRLKKDFSWSELTNGLIKYLFTLCGVLFVEAAGLLLPDVSVITINGESVTITAALGVVLLAIIIVYVKKCFDNMVELFENVKVEIGEEEDILSQIDEIEGDPELLEGEIEIPETDEDEAE